MGGGGGLLHFSPAAAAGLPGAPLPRRPSVWGWAQQSSGCGLANCTGKQAGHECLDSPTHAWRWLRGRTPRRRLGSSPAAHGNAQRTDGGHSHAAAHLVSQRLLLPQLAHVLRRQAAPRAEPAALQLLLLCITARAARRAERQRGLALQPCAHSRAGPPRAVPPTPLLAQRNRCPAMFAHPAPVGLSSNQSYPPGSGGSRALFLHQAAGLTWRQLLLHSKGVVVRQLNLVQIEREHVPAWAQNAAAAVGQAAGASHAGRQPAYSGGLQMPARLGRRLPGWGTRCTAAGQRTHHDTRSGQAQLAGSAHFSTSRRRRRRAAAIASSDSSSYCIFFMPLMAPGAEGMAGRVCVGRGGLQTDLPHSSRTASSSCP